MSLSQHSPWRHVLSLAPPGLVGRSARLLALASFACAGDAVVIEPRAPIEVSVAPSALTLSVGQSVQLNGTVRGSSNTGISWRASPPGIAVVTAAGQLTAITPGTALVVAIAQADSARRATASVTVTGSKLIIGIAPATAAVEVGRTVRFSASPAAWKWNWSSRDPAVASVDTTGLAAGHRSGSTVITAIAQIDSTLKASAVLTVVDLVAGEATQGYPQLRRQVTGRPF